MLNQRGDSAAGEDWSGEERWDEKVSLVSCRKSLKWTLNGSATSREIAKDINTDEMLIKLAGPLGHIEMANGQTGLRKSLLFEIE